MIWKLKWFEHQWVEQGAVQYKQWCVDAMNSVPGQFSLHSHIRTTLQKLCQTFSFCLVTVCYFTVSVSGEPLSSSCHRMSLSSSLPLPVCSVDCLSDACPIFSSSFSSSESPSSSLSSFSSFFDVSAIMN